LNKFPFGITDLGEWKNLSTKDIEPYIELRAVQKRAYFKDGNRIFLPDVYYKFRDCTTDDFQNTDFEKKFAHVLINIWKVSRYCIDDPKHEIHLQGDKNSVPSLQNYS